MTHTKWGWRGCCNVLDWQKPRHFARWRAASTTTATGRTACCNCNPNLPRFFWQDLRLSFCSSWFSPTDDWSIFTAAAITISNIWMQRFQFRGRWCSVTSICTAYKKNVTEKLWKASVHHMTQTLLKCGLCLTGLQEAKENINTEYFIRIYEWESN